MASANTARDTATTTRRSIEAVARANGMLVTMTVIAHTEMSRPMLSGSTRNDAAISGMSPVGSDSAVTVTRTARASSRSAPSGNRGAEVDAAVGIEVG